MDLKLKNTGRGRLLALKIDVDTHDGMAKGVPKLLDILNKEEIKATFCLSFGPDNAGKAIFRLFNDPLFLKKMLKTGAPRLYGLRTILSGTLLPARPIAIAFPDLVRRIEADGHEAIVHAWDHRKWQDRLTDMTSEEIAREFDRAFSAFQDILDKRPEAVAAPGWQVTPESLEIQDELGLLYASDLRGGEPARLSIGDRIFKTLQIPSTGPCIEELLTIGIRDNEDLFKAILRQIYKAKYPVIPIHAEVEGGPFSRFLIRLLRMLKTKYNIVRLKDMAAILLGGTVPIRELSFMELPGRAGTVATSIGPEALREISEQS
ncbi:MAG: polysaccharide deacetylase family protein [Dissulfurimicrobium sp.]|uniref:polysaccharide deacetylase family protein n=1 Tax=Dissulfurimicrobium TaxID=1769732 RepID=UPI001EDBDD30|nr:polysaccharide deacetylase family protein [Dissulfurimicrobium hydrothermale]UKL13048.1 polysaccharide deacetylase family protein [Dissulfurimicrobium hydrothermale]